MTWNMTEHEGQVVDARRVLGQSPVSGIGAGPVRVGTQSPSSLTAPAGGSARPWHFVKKNFQVRLGGVLKRQTLLFDVQGRAVDSCGLEAAPALKLALLT